MSAFSQSRTNQEAVAKVMLKALREQTKDSDYDYVTQVAEGFVSISGKFDLYSVAEAVLEAMK